MSSTAAVQIPGSSAGQETDGIVPLSNPNLPYEVIFLIIEQLVSERPALSFEYPASVRAALIALALTSKALQPYVTNLLFEKMSVRTPTQLRTLGMARTKNLKLIRSLYIQIGGPRFNRPLNLSLQDAATQLHNVLTGPIVGTIDRLALHFAFPRSAYSSWELLYFDRSVKTAVQKVIPGLIEFAALERSMFFDLLPWVPTELGKIRRLHLTVVQDVRHSSDTLAIFSTPNLSFLQIPHFDGSVDLQGLILRHPQLSTVVLYHFQIPFVDGLPNIKRSIEMQRNEPIHFYLRGDGSINGINESLIQGDYMSFDDFREVQVEDGLN